MQSVSPPPAASPRSVGLAELFTGFLALGLMSFGGALPFARRTIVDERKWLSADEFTDLLGLCQFLPGGNVINLSVAVGMRFRGVAGAFAGILGLIAGPTLVVVALGVLYAKTQNDPHVQHLFAGLAAAAAGLL
ncbi:chromate transporter, partial [Burkholderia stabilis]